MKIKHIVSMAAVILLSANLAWAQGEKTQAPTGENAVQKITSETKKARKKKVEMCSECGKPESECDCPGHKKEDSSSKKTGDGK